MTLVIIFSKQSAIMRNEKKRFLGKTEHVLTASLNLT